MRLYRTIVADPPWKVAAGRTIGNYVRAPDGSQAFGVRDNAARRISYSTMTVEQIAALPIGNIATPNAHLYLWTINRYLREAFYVLERWGFNYSTTLVWAKRPMGGGLGGIYGLATEYVLFGRRGKLPGLSRVGRNWWDWKRPYDTRGKPRHSAKPAEFFDLVREVSPGPYLEMFARSARAGWHVWGDEVKSDVKLVA